MLPIGKRHTISHTWYNETRVVWTVVLLYAAVYDDLAIVKLIVRLSHIVGSLKVLCRHILL